MSSRRPLVINAGLIQQLQASDYADIGIPYTRYKNRVLNADFNIWQRGPAISGIANNAYFADQWKLLYDGTGCVVSGTQELFPLGSNTPPDNPKYYCQIQVSTAATGQTYLAMVQNIESVNIFQNQTVTLSFWAKASAPMTINGAIIQNFGTDGTPSPPEQAIPVVTVQGVGTVNVTTSWQQCYMVFDVPSTSGKTLGGAGDDFLQIQFGLPINQTFTLDISHVQLEFGTTATSFEWRPFGTDLLACQRYFCITGGGAIGVVASSTVWQGVAVLPTPMRGVPSLKLTTGTPTVAQIGVRTYTASGAGVGFYTTPEPNVGLMAAINIGGFSGMNPVGALTVLNDNCIEMSAET